MEIRLVRHATLIVRLDGKALLVDPMLSPPGAMPPIQNTPNDRRNPLVGLPELDLSPVDAVLVTHTHADHFDEAAAGELRKDLPVLCQPEDEEKISSHGFANVLPVKGSLDWEGIEVHRTGGRHGTGEIGALMAPVSGFVLRAPGEPTLYVAGDTVWCPEVEDALAEHAPDVVVVNAGAARFNEGDPITMTAGDVAEVARHAGGATVVAVHMEAINHCLLGRDELRSSLAEAEVSGRRVLIPADGEQTAF
ncbi:MBL fold metallo-hydrolase [Rubrobacter marinus]|uniref:MBL fold metallo-hydrolase n=1 Tax=Rubrobacter marinus TaxID=2653852 RepID=A0A6G8Q2A9_9ACTN|nr:MBL fold metallo-hydrolase [Rubrobacter marinus]QIN80560.1 MBL fold metallo-hydrolase [Rubrobacter marinus]